jgi:hypothetical protein
LSRRCLWREVRRKLKECLRVYAVDVCARHIEPVRAHVASCNIPRGLFGVNFGAASYRRRLTSCRKRHEVHYDARGEPHRKQQAKRNTPPAMQFCNYAQHHFAEADSSNVLGAPR